MTRFHRLIFFFWKIWMYLNGIKPGTFFWTYSNSKQKKIQGVVTYLSGDSITKDKFGFNIGINWLEPLQGNDSRYHTFGCYTYRDIKEKLTR